MTTQPFWASFLPATPLLILAPSGTPLGISIEKRTLAPMGESPSLFDAGVYPSKKTITYALHVPRLSPEDTLLAIKNYIQDQLGEEISNDSSIVFLEQPSKNTSRTVSAVLVKNTPLEEWLDQQAPCRWYFPKTLCLQAFYERFCPQDRSIFLIDYDDTEITLIFFQNSSLLACRTIPVEENTDISQQIKASLLAWESETTSPLIVRTGTCSFPQDNFSNEILAPETNVQPFFENASSVGAAILATPSLSSSLPPAIASAEKKPYLSVWKKTVLLAAFFSLLTSLFFILQEHRQAKRIKKQIENTLAFVNKQQWSQSLSPKVPSKIETYEHLEDALLEAKKALQKQALYPVQPALPTLSSILAWLNEQAKKVCSAKDSFEIQKITYTLLQYPTIDQMQKKYQLRIDLECTTPDPQLARRFHEVLMTKNDMIARPSEVTWTANGSVYKTSFYIQDKTRYYQVP